MTSKRDQKDTTDLLEHHLKALVAENLKINGKKIELYKTPEQLGADSLDVVEIIMAVEEFFCIDISDEEAFGLKTLQDLYDLIHARQAQNEELTAMLNPKPDQKKHRVYLGDGSRHHAGNMVHHLCYGTGKQDFFEHGGLIVTTLAGAHVWLDYLEKNGHPFKVFSDNARIGLLESARTEQAVTVFIFDTAAEHSPDISMARFGWLKQALSLMEDRTQQPGMLFFDCISYLPDTHMQLLIKLGARIKLVYGISETKNEVMAKSITYVGSDNSIGYRQMMDSFRTIGHF